MTTATQHYAASAQATPNDTADEKRYCIVSFMDNHSEVFPTPDCAANWTEFLQQARTPTDRDASILDQAVGRIMQTLRSAQEGIPSQMNLADLLQRAKEEGVGEFEPDPLVSAMAGDSPAPQDIETMARAMTLYKQCMSAGAASGSEIAEAIHAGFESLPADTPFMRDLIDTAKQIAMIDLNQALGNG